MTAPHPMPPPAQAAPPTHAPLPPGRVPVHGTYLPSPTTDQGRRAERAENWSLVLGVLAFCGGSVILGSLAIVCAHRARSYGRRATPALVLAWLATVLSAVALLVGLALFVFFRYGVS